MRRILSVLLENESGALSRVVGLFSQRGYNIETLNVAPTEDHSLSRLTVTTSGDDLKIEQITKHLNKIIDVVKVVDLTEGAQLVVGDPLGVGTLPYPFYVAATVSHQHDHHSIPDFLGLAAGISEE